MDLANAVILVFVKKQIIPKLVGMLVFWIGQCFFVKNGVKSYPFEELILNQASGTLYNFDKYPKSPK